MVGMATNYLSKLDGGNRALHQQVIVGQELTAKQHGDRETHESVLQQEVV